MYEGLGTPTKEQIGKYNKLRSILKDMGSVAVAFSGGVDSTFLVRAAREAVGDRLVAITARSDFFPTREFREAEEFCKNLGVCHVTLDVRGEEVENFRENPPDRCYYCKQALFTSMQTLAAEWGIKELIDGSNTDDAGDYRPGQRAIEELGIRSPLREADLSKEDIRVLSKAKEIPTWSKPSFACLASRFVYGEEITRDKLDMVDKAEEILMNMGFEQFRVRIHGNIARLEVLPEEILRLAEENTRIKITEKLKELGFLYVTLDLDGYRTGSMNEVLE